MSSLTESLCRSLSALPEKDVSEQGARLIHHVWSRSPGDGTGVSRPPVASPGALNATDYLGRKVPVETAAFNNAFRFATEHCKGELSEKGTASEQACCAVPVFSATALAQARALDCQGLSYAVGLGIETYSRLVKSLASGATHRGFDPHVLAATFAAIVACGTIERLPSDKLAQALGLGGSAITALMTGYLPVQAAMAARDGIVMVLLVACGFKGPPDPLACRWGVYETFAGAAETSSLDVSPQTTRASDDLRRLFGDSSEGDDSLCKSHGPTAVQQFVADVLGI